MIGLAVMGSNLARNMESKGYPVAVYDIDRACRAEVHGYLWSRKI